MGYRVVLTEDGIYELRITHREGPRTKTTYSKMNPRHSASTLVSLSVGVLSELAEMAAALEGPVIDMKTMEEVPDDELVINDGQLRLKGE